MTIPRTNVKDFDQVRRSIDQLIKAIQTGTVLPTDPTFNTVTVTTGFLGPQIGPSGDADLLELTADVATVNGRLDTTGEVRAGNRIRSGSGNHYITSSVGLLDGSKLDPGVAVADTPQWGTGTPKSGRFTTVTSTVATGTAPFTVASTTVVANLNASLLLGKTWAIPDPIGATTANTGRFTTVTSTIATGTAPFTVTSTTVVANLNVSQLLGKTWAVPDPIGATTPNTVKCTDFEATGSLKFGTFVSDLVKINVKGHILVTDVGGTVRRLAVVDV
jgi:hypothetical protein